MNIHLFWLLDIFALLFAIVNDTFVVTCFFLLKVMKRLLELISLTQDFPFDSDSFI